MHVRALSRFLSLLDQGAAAFVQWAERPNSAPPGRRGADIVTTIEPGVTAQDSTSSTSLRNRTISGGSNVGPSFYGFFENLRRYPIGWVVAEKSVSMHRLWPTVERTEPMHSCSSVDNPPILLTSLR